MKTFVIVAAAALILCGCSQEFSRDRAVASFREVHPETSEEQGSCVVDRLLEVYTLDELEAQLLADPVQAEFEETQFRAMFACGVMGDVRVQLASQLADSGVADDKVDCVADALVDELDENDIDVLLSGEITDAFYQKFFTAMDLCGAVN